MRGQPAAPPGREDAPIARPTSIDVAARAGVSQSTVSLVLSGKDRGRVAPATADAVRTAAADLGYRPHAAARSLRTGTAGAVGLLVPDVRNPFFGAMLRGAQRAAWAEGTSIALVDFDDDPEQAAAAHDTLAAGLVDGILHFGWNGPARPGPVPVVLIEAERRGVDSVRLDVEDGIRQAYAHLLGLGHRRIAHLRSNVDEQTFVLRLDGARAVLDEHGLDYDALPSARAPFTVPGARAAAAALVRDLPAGERPTAVVCDDDILAAGLVGAAHDAGLDVPGDLSIVGFDDLDIAGALDLTTVRIDAEALGRGAYGLLRDRIATPGARRRREVQPVTLLERASTAPPRG